MITIITGDTNAYKTAFVEKLIPKLENADGVLSKKNFTHERFDGYLIQQISSGICKDFLSLSKLSDAQIGEFFIQQEGLAFAKAAIQQATENNKLVVIDELGQAELAGLVFYDELSMLLNRNNDALLVIRKRLLNAFQDKFPQLRKAKIIEVTNGE